MDDVKDIDEQEKGNIFEIEKKSEGQASSARESSCSVLTDDEELNDRMTIFYRGCVTLALRPNSIGRKVLLLLYFAIDLHFVRGLQYEACQVCLEELEQFWDESLEEWRYKNATRINGRTYHVSCYDGADVGSVIEIEDGCPLSQHQTILTNERNLSNYPDTDERLMEQKTKQNLSSPLFDSSKHDDVLLQNGTETNHSSPDTVAQVCQVNQDSN
eukprot:gene4-9600_t